MTAARTLLIVCTANRCRSPMAEGIVRARLADAGGDDLEVRSAGTWAVPGVPPTDHAVRVMAERGIDISAQRANEVDGALMEAADLVLAMTAGHKEALCAEFPAACDRVRLMSTLAGGRWDIVDPVGGTLDEYRATADELTRLIDAGWDEIVGGAARA